MKLNEITECFLMAFELGAHAKILEEDEHCCEIRFQDWLLIFWFYGDSVFAPDRELWFYASACNMQSRKESDPNIPEVFKLLLEKFT